MPNHQASHANSVVGSVTSAAQGSFTKDGLNSGSGSNYLNLPPSGKSGKKPLGGSSSSRARNVSHISHKDSDKDDKGTSANNLHTMSSAAANKKGSKTASNTANK